MTDTKPIECELVTSDIEKLDKLVKYASETGLEPTATTGLVKAFQPIFAKARAVIADSVGVAESVKDATCVREIRKSRACRLAIRAVRLESDATRKNQKENALRYGRAVDGFHNILLADLMPVEEMLQEAENIAERAEAARLAALQEAREKELIPYLETPAWISNLSNLTDAEYAKVLSDAKLLKQAKIDAAAKAEAEAKAKAEAERLERERIASENARLAAEAARLKAEAEAREAAARKEREEAARALAAERLAAEAAAKAAAELARKEREAVEAKARAERLAAEAAAKQEQARLKAIADDQLKRVIAAEAAAKALRDAEAKRQSEAAAARKSAAALFGGSKPDSRPDNAKAQAFADSLRAMPLPKFTGKAFDGLPARIENLAQWIESQIGEGGLL